MANKYLAATGNWNSTSIWSDSFGGAVGASVPSSSDTVYILTYTVTLTANVDFSSGGKVFISSGRLNLGQYKMTFGTAGVLLTTGTAPKILDLGSGTLEFNEHDTISTSALLDLSSANTTLIAGTSTITYNSQQASSGLSLKTGGLTFNDVRVNLGYAATNSTTLNITGSPTFRLLDIRSTNAAAHTVNFDGTTARVTANKFIAIGSSTTNRLTIRTVTGVSPGGFIFPVGSTCYGQNLNMVDTHAYSDASNSPVVTPVYVGSNSIKNNSGAAWLLQDPPKISTLVDPLTTAPGSNTNWTVAPFSGATLPTASITGSMGGGYTFDATTEGIISTNTYDIVDEDFIFEVSSATGSYTMYSGIGWLSGQAFASVFGIVGLNYGAIVSMFSPSTGIVLNSQTSKNTVINPAPTPRYFVKIRYDSALKKFKSSYSNGGAWLNETISSATLPDDATVWLKSSRIQFNSNSASGATSDLGSINPSLNASPTVTLSTPANNTVLTTTTPTLAFTATDPEADAVSYQVQVGDITFTTLHTDATTTTFASGSAQSYTLATALTTGGIDYYWRVRAKDPSGSNTYGAWSEVRKMTTQAIAPTVTSGASSSLTTTTATVAGNVTSSGGGTITERGAVYATTASPTTANSKKIVTGTTGAFTADLTVLAPGTTYNWRAYAINSVGTSYGTNQTFTTAPLTPTITAVYDVLDTGAKVDVEVLAGGGATITARGIVYSLTANPTLASSVITSGSGAGTFTTTITGLTASTLYYVKAYATNATGTTYGTQSSFTTDQPNSVPTVTTGTTSSIAATTADFLASEVTNDGNFAVTERGVVLSKTNPTPTTLDLKATSVASGLGSYNVSITGLEQETTYYARAYATSSYGTGYGAVITFTTTVLFVNDAGDGYWTWTPSGSDAVIGRSQSTPIHSSTNLLLSDLNLENGQTYTLYYSAKANTNGATKMVLQRFNGATKIQNEITAGTPYTFVYDTTKLFWAIRLFVTGVSVEASNITATFSDLYLAKEPTFSGYVPFVANGLTEIKIENNWLADKQRTGVIASMFSAMNGQSWYPFNIDTEGLGWFEIGDKFTIQDDAGKNYPVVLWNSKITVDGGIKETLFTKTPDLTETNYSKAGKLGGLWKRTQIEVDKNKQQIQSLVEDIYDYDGVINTKFSEVLQDVNEIRTTVQGTGGVNLIQNSVMYAFDTSNVPTSWAVTGAGTLLIQASPESLTAGAVAGNAFSLTNKTVKQTITVRKDVAFIPEAQKTYYAISAKVKKNVVGTAWIKLTNRNETLTIALPDQTGYYWDTVKLEEILPKDDYYEIEIYSDSDAGLQVTDLMFAPGKTKREWSQANGEVMNSSVSITKNGMTIRSPQFQNDYTKIDALGFEVHSKEVGGARVFGFNKDETNVSKLKADKQISMSPLRTVPINYGTYKGWAFTLSETI